MSNISSISERLRNEFSNSQDQSSVKSIINNESKKASQSIDSKTVSNDPVSISEKLRKEFSSNQPDLSKTQPLQADQSMIPHATPDQIPLDVTASGARRLEGDFTSDVPQTNPELGSPTLTEAQAAPESGTFGGLDENAMTETQLDSPDQRPIDISPIKLNMVNKFKNVADHEDANTLEKLIAKVNLTGLHAAGRLVDFADNYNKLTELRKYIPDESINILGLNTHLSPRDILAPFTSPIPYDFKKMKDHLNDYEKSLSVLPAYSALAKDDQTFHDKPWSAVGLSDVPEMLSLTLGTAADMSQYIASEAAFGIPGVFANLFANSVGTAANTLNEFEKKFGKKISLGTRALVTVGSGFLDAVLNTFGINAVTKGISKGLGGKIIGESFTAGSIDKTLSKFENAISQEIKNPGFVKALVNWFKPIAYGVTTQAGAGYATELGNALIRKITYNPKESMTEAHNAGIQAAIQQGGAALGLQLGGHAAGLLLNKTKSVPHGTKEGEANAEEGRGQTVQTGEKETSQRQGEEGVRVRDDEEVKDDVKTEGESNAEEKSQEAKEEEGVLESDQIIKELKQAEAKDKEGGFLTLPNKAPSVESLQEAGVKIESRKKSPLSNLLGLQPMRELAKNDPVAGEIVRKGRNTIAHLDEELSLVYGKIKKGFKGIGKHAFEKIVDLQEKGISDAEVKKLPAKYKEAIETMRFFNKEIRKIAEEMGIDTSKWGFTEDNYFHHLFLGDQMLKVNGETNFIGDFKDVSIKAQELIDSGTPPADISIGPKVNKDSAPTTLLSNKGFWSFVNRMSEKMEISKDEILEELHGVAGINVKKKFVGAFKERKANLEGYLKDPSVVYQSLWNRVLKKKYLDKFTKETTSMVDKIKEPWLKKEMKEYIEYVGGKYIDPSYFLGVNVSQLSQSIRKAESNLKLAYRPDSALLNRLQPLQTAYSELGKYYFIGEWRRLTKSGKDIIKKIDIGEQAPKYSTGERGQGKQEIYKPMGMFSEAELQNREVAALGGYLKGINELKMSESEAIKYAKDVASSTQFVNNISDLPKIVRNSIGAAALQFKPFAINYIYNFKNTIMGKPLGGLEPYFERMYPTKTSKVMRAVRFLGSNAAIGGLKAIHKIASPVGVGLVSYLAIQHPEIFNGILSYIGIDMSKRTGSSPMDIIPDESTDLLGPIGGDIKRAYKAFKNYFLKENDKGVKEHNPEDLIDLIRISPAAWNIYRSMADEEGVQPTNWERIMTGFGIEPSRLSTIREGMNQLGYFKPEQRTRALFLPTEESIQNMIYNLRAKDYDEDKKEIVRIILDKSGIQPSDYNRYLNQRRLRMKKSRKN